MSAQTSVAQAVHQAYYDQEQDRIVFPDHIKKQSIFEPNYESLYEDCTDDINEAFGLNLTTTPYEIQDLTDSIKATIKKKLKKALETDKKYANCEIQNSDDVVQFHVEFKKLLNALKISKCFHIEDAAGNIRGVKPPRSFSCQLGLIPVPWKFLYIDFKAQRFTDISHIVDKILDYDPKKNLGLTGRFDPSGRKVDINDGRHSAMLLALTGIDHALIRGPFCAERTTNMNVFEVLNSMAKPITTYDEVKFIYGRAEIEKDSGGIKAIDTRKRTTGSKLRISDRQIYEMFDLLRKFKIELVPTEMGKQNRRHLDKRQWFRVDMLIKFIQDPNYTKWASTGEIEDTWMYDSLDVINDVLLDNDGYAPHELVWAINQLFYQTNKESILSKSDRERMREALKIALKEWLSPINLTAWRKMLDRSYEFYLEYSRAKDRIPSSSSLSKLSMGNTNVQHFLATALYSIVQECPSIKSPVKQLFVVPTLNWSEKDNSGNDIQFIDQPLLDDRGLPFSLDRSFITTKSKAKEDAVSVVSDDDDNDE